VIGGSALLTLGLVARVTRDIDVVAIVIDGQLSSAAPLPARWSRTHDPSAGYLSILERVLAFFGVDGGAVDA
jgi:hypothetical protein